jgi:integrase
VINLARNRGYIGFNKAVPLLDGKGQRSKPRPAFSAEEIKELLCYTATWQKSSYTERTAHMRTLCSFYIEFLVNTGVRHGTEALPLRWKHLQWHWIGDKKYLRIWVSGKTGPRYLIAKNVVIKVLERVLKWQKLPYSGLDAIIEAKFDRLIFRLPTGEQISNMENIFRNLMVRSCMRMDSGGQNRTLYSLRHTYATFALTDGIDIHTLARQMGTSQRFSRAQEFWRIPLLEVCQSLDIRSRTQGLQAGMQEVWWKKICTTQDALGEFYVQ